VVLEKEEGRLVKMFNVLKKTMGRGWMLIVTDKLQNKISGCSERFKCKAREEPAGEAYIAIRRTGRFACATPQMSLYQQPA
jgi:hypothetical protein